MPAVTGQPLRVGHPKITPYNQMVLQLLLQYGHQDTLQEADSVFCQYNVAVDSGSTLWWCIL